MLNDDLKQMLAFLSIVVAIVLIFLYALFGFSGIMAGISIIFVALPFYLILDKFKLEQGEKFLFSALLGLTVFPSLAYMLGLVVSFRMSIILSFFMFIIAAFIVRKYKIKK